MNTEHVFKVKFLYKFIDNPKKISNRTSPPMQEVVRSCSVYTHKYSAHCITKLKTPTRAPSLHQRACERIVSFFLQLIYNQQSTK